MGRYRELLGELDLAGPTAFPERKMRATALAEELMTVAEGIIGTDPRVVRE